MAQFKQGVQHWLQKLSQHWATFTPTRIETLSWYWPQSGYWNWADTNGIGPQSHQREIKYLASTGPNPGTEAEPTPPALGHNHTGEKWNT